MEAFIKLLFMLLSFCFVSLSMPSHALSKLGHKVICQLSYQHLSAPTKAKIEQLLVNIPVKEQQRINRYNYRKLNKKITFVDSCTWADAIKKDHAYEQYKSWHYQNINRKQQQISQIECTKPCITSAIKWHYQQLNTSSGWQQTQALLFLGHWLGDIHQPLHISFADDRGGNLTKVVWKGQKCKNLHWLWDECLLTKHAVNLAKNKIINTEKGKNKLRHQTILVKHLHQLWQKAPIKQWQQQGITDWANESLTIVRSPDFNYCKVDNNQVCHKLPTNSITLTDNYYRKFSQTIDTQLLKAAARLTVRLEQALL